MHGEPAVRPRILVVDDSKLMRKAAQKMLGDEFDVVSAEDGEDAWGQICSDPGIQVVFTDLNMPGVDGFELLQRVRGSENSGVQSLPIIVVTGAENDEAARMQALNAGATDFITKPFTTTDLVARARAHANNQRITRQLQAQATLDSLTGLSNRSGFLDRLHQDIAYARRHHLPLSLVRLEIVDFRRFFLYHGRDVAETLVLQVARLVRARIRKEDTAARIGLGGFALSLPGGDAVGIDGMIQRLRAEMAAQPPLDEDGQPVAVVLAAAVLSPDLSHSPSAQAVLEQCQALLDAPDVALAEATAAEVAEVAEMATAPAPVIADDAAEIVQAQPADALANTPAPPVVLIDPLLAELAAGNPRPLAGQLPQVIGRLLPLFRLLGPKQRAQLVQFLQRLAPCWLVLAYALGSPALAFDQGRVVEGELAVIAPRDRVAVENRILNDRLDTLLPRLMADTNIDLWLVLSREYAEDPIYFTLVPQPSHAARRTTLLAFHRKPDGTVEKLAVNRYPLGEPYTSAWSGGDLDAQWQALGQLIGERDPQRIGINVSKHWPIADGLSHALHQRLLDVLPEGFESRLVSAEDLVVRWTETRTDAEQAIYPHIVALARSVVSEAFSSRVITPGVTTTDDVAWYIRGRYEGMGLPIWFMPDVNFQRQGQACEEGSDFCGSEGVIERGDVLHTDVGFCYLKLCTDTQEMGYVLREGEDAVPPGLLAALATGNRWQDLLTAEFKTGRRGGEILAAARQAAEREAIVSSVYSHPLGFFGHAAGPTIGMWDDQSGSGEGSQWPLYANTAYAIEGNAKARVPEWDGQWVQIKLEQSALFDGERVNYLAGRQTQWHVVR